MTLAARAVVLARAFAVVVVVLLVQVTVAGELRFAGVQAELLLGLAASAGVVAGPDRGAMVGFAAGLAYDTFLQSPIGLTALVYAAVAYATGVVQLQLASQTRRARMASVGLATTGGVVLWVGLAWVLDQAQVPALTLAKVAVVAGVVNAAWALAGTRLLAWVFAPDRVARP